ncbi:hypothetical protein DVH24_014133 [Malus domestica]|uniref:Uncharacterized protein n=1 Tax=Malus domestica TaxID=3750 RepID=A0A498JFI1_MALDO|nr:hypothetical protein DVH24_014133 [Malus domestica]
MNIVTIQYYDMLLHVKRKEVPRFLQTNVSDKKDLNLRIFIMLICSCEELEAVAMGMIGTYMMALPTTKNGSMNYRSNLLHFVGLYGTIKEYVKVGHNIHMKATPFWRLYRAYRDKLAYDEDDALSEIHIEIQADDPIKQDEDEQINDVLKDVGIVVVAHLIVPISPILHTPTSKSIENNIKNNMCSVKTRSSQFEAPTWDIVPNNEKAKKGKEMKPSGCLPPHDPITEEIDCDTYVMKKVARKCLEKNIYCSV